MNKLIQVLYILGIPLYLGIFLPLTLELLNLPAKISFISYLGSFLILFLIVIVIIDLLLLVFKKKNFVLLAYTSMCLAISLFLLLGFCFFNNYFAFTYVWSYSESSLPLVYKFAAIWAGREGSIITWLVFNQVVIAVYRIKNDDPSDTVFIRSNLLILVISSVFSFILLSMDTFSTQYPVPPDGYGLNPLLQSPYMIIHPLFVFLGYAIFIVPFAITLSEFITKGIKLKGLFQRKFLDFTFKFGWLLITLGIGIGAYWASLTIGWGGYWAWDPVETVSLIPWLVCTAYFHSAIIKKKNELLVKFTIISIFLANIYTTVLTRGGGFVSVHAFAGDEQLVYWAIALSIILLALLVYSVYNVLNLILEEKTPLKLIVDYLSYFFLMMMAFLFLIGLLIPPLTYALQSVLNIEVIVLGPGFFSTGGLILAIGLAITMIFCSLIDLMRTRSIGIYIVAGLAFGILLSSILYYSLALWINPLISIYFMAFCAALYNLLKHFRKSNDVRTFFRRNAKVFIHSGIALILIGSIIGILPSVQSFFYILGFMVISVSIVPAILLIAFQSKSINPTQNLSINDIT